MDRPVGAHSRRAPLQGADIEQAERSSALHQAVGVGWDGSPRWGS